MVGGHVVQGTYHTRSMASMGHIVQVPSNFVRGHNGRGQTGIGSFMTRLRDREYKGKIGRGGGELSHTVRACSTTE
jgi:hypothetical protein